MDWFRLYAEFASDPKVQMMSEAMQRRLVMLMCLHRTNGGHEFTDEEVAFHLRIGDGDVIETKRLLSANGFIDGQWRLSLPLETKPERPARHEWAEIRLRIFVRDDYTCQYCGQRGGRLECDHVVPVARGGCHDDVNLVTACFICNRSKRDKLVSEWRRA